MGTRGAALQALFFRCIPPIAHLPIRRQFVRLASFSGGEPRRYGSISTTRSPLHRQTGDTTFRTYSRRRNIFLDPQKTDEELTTLYGSGRFNDDDMEEEWNNLNAEEVEEDTLMDTPLHDNISEDIQEEGATSSTATTTTTKLAPAHNVRVRSAEFIKSSVSHSDCPATGFPEFAIIGRSNVGKSSLINLLTGRQSLAMVSKTPGKTRCINHFLINNAWYLVDLPGYGYARTSKDNVLHWNKFTREYFIKRESLVSVLLLVDASIPPMGLDLACAAWLAEAEVPMTVVYTKMDKKKKGCPPPEENIALFEEKLLDSWEKMPPTIATSSRTGAGKGLLLAHIARLRSLYNAHAL